MIFFFFQLSFFPLIPVVNALTRILVPEGQLEYGFMSLKDNWQIIFGTLEVVHELRLKHGNLLVQRMFLPRREEHK